MTTNKTTVAEKEERTPELQPQEAVLKIRDEFLVEPEDEKVQPAPPQKKKFAEGLCFDKLVWILSSGALSASSWKRSGAMRAGEKSKAERG